MRSVSPSLVLAGVAMLALAIAQTPARAGDYDEIRRLLNEERFTMANMVATRERASHPPNKKLEWMWARTVQGCGWEAQLRMGFEFAAEFLGGNLGEHEVIEHWYAVTCEWAGMEEEGIEKLRQSALPESRRIDPELRLLTLLRRYEEADARARGVEFAERDRWLEWIGKEAAKRDRLESRARRGWTVFLVGLGGFAVVVATLFRRFRSLSPSGSSGSRS